MQDLHTPNVRAVHNKLWTLLLLLLSRRVVLAPSAKEDVPGLSRQNHSAASARLHGTSFYSLYTHDLRVSNSLQIRNIVQVLISHPAFLEDGDTVERLHEDQKEEARLVDEDRTKSDGPGGSLFKGRFKSGPRLSTYDPSDGVYRCPECNWELEGTFCVRCDRIFDIDDISDAALGLSDDDDDDDEVDDYDDEFDSSDDISRSSEDIRGIHGAFEREAMQGWSSGRSPPYGTTSPYYGLHNEDRSPPSAEDAPSRHFWRATASDVDRARIASGAESFDTWSGSEPESEEYQTPSLSPSSELVAAAGHPAFAPSPSDSTGPNDDDPDMDDFIDDGSVELGSHGTERAESDDSADRAAGSAELADDMPVRNRRRRPILDDDDDDDDDDADEGREAGSVVSGQLSDRVAVDIDLSSPQVAIREVEAHPVDFDDRPQQQRKRRRVVVVESDDEDDAPHDRNERPHTRRRLNSYCSPRPQQLSHRSGPSRISHGHARAFTATSSSPRRSFPFAHRYCRKVPLTNMYEHIPVEAVSQRTWAPFNVPTMPPDHLPYASGSSSRSNRYGGSVPKDSRSVDR